jgi:hypothetical protein
VLVAGSIARGDDDEVSDIDLWVQADAWSADVFDGLFLAGTVATVGDGPLFHAVDHRGVIVDIRFGPEAPPEYVPLQRFELEPWPKGKRAAEGLTTDFWINSYKSRKPLWRGLESMLVFGLHFERMMLVKAWVERDSGSAPPPSAFSIHGLTSIVRDHITPARQELLGLPLRKRPEILIAIQTYRQEMISLAGASELSALVMTDPVFLELCKIEGVSSGDAG